MDGFSEKLKKIMKYQGINENQLAKKLGVSRAAVHRYTHENRLPETFTYVKMCRIFGVDCEWFF